MPGWESIRGCTCKATNVASSSSPAGEPERCDPADGKGCGPSFVAQAFAAVVAIGALAAGNGGSVEARPGGPTMPEGGGGIF